MNNSDLIFWGAGTIRTQRPLWLALEMDLDFQHRHIGPRNGDTLTPEFLRLNPRHKVPVMNHGNMVLTESTAIMEYMTTVFPLPNHIYCPASPVERARQSEWCYFIMSELDANGLYTMRRHGALKQIYGDSPIAVDGGRTYFLHQLDQMKEHLRFEDPFLMGPMLSIADVLLTTCLDWAVAYQIELPQRLEDYRIRMNARPAYRSSADMNVLAESSGMPSSAPGKDL